MDASTAHHHHQEMSSQTLESMLVCTKPQQEKKPRPTEQAQKCPRCDSTNTKFCYYNNYSLSQPRYFCKSCRRYWTKGGTLRNVPVGGGCRKNKRSSSSSSAKRSQDHSMNASPSPSPIPSLSHLGYDSNDISLAIARLQQKQQSTGHMGFDDQDFGMVGNGQIPLGNSNIGLFDALRGGFLESPHGFHHQNLYYGSMGMENGSMGMGMSLGNEDIGMGMGMGYVEMSGGATTSSTAVTTVKQEICNARGVSGGNESRVLFGFPWQVGGDHGNLGIGGDLESGRQSWNGIGSSWHGLLNSPLM